MSDIYSGSEKMLGAIKKQRTSAQNASVNADRLPYELTKAYREQGDPTLTKQINQAEQDTQSAGIVGLDKFKHIENPFTRRALAEKYQGGVAVGYKNLLTEQDRRQGVVSDYINMWSGTYGAIAKGEQMKLEGMTQDFNTSMDLASKREQTRQFNVTQANKGTSTEKNGEFRQYLNESLNGSVGEDGHVDPVKYAELRDEAYAQSGMSKSQFDAQYASALNPSDHEKLGVSVKEDKQAKEKTAKQQNEEKYYTLLNDIQSGNANGMEIDSKGNIIKKDDGGWFGSATTKTIFKKP